MFKMFYAHDLPFYAHSCLNRAHEIFVYFASQIKFTAIVFGAPFLAPGAYASFAPYPPPLRSAPHITGDNDGWYRNGKLYLWVKLRLLYYLVLGQK